MNTKIKFLIGIAQEFFCWGVKEFYTVILPALSIVYIVRIIDPAGDHWLLYPAFFVIAVKIISVAQKLAVYKSEEKMKEHVDQEVEWLKFKMFKMNNKNE